MIKTIGWLFKYTFTIWKEVIKVMINLDVFKPTDMLVKSQITLFLIGMHKDILDVPNLYNLRKATAEAMGMDYEEAVRQAEERRAQETEEEE